MKTATRPQYHRLQRILELIREGTRAGSLPNCGHFTLELAVSRRTLMRDLDFLRDDHHAPIAYDDSRKGFKLTDPTFKLAPVELTRREVFSFSIARKLLERFEGTPLELDMRSVLAKIADSLRGTVSLDVESLTDQFTVLAEDHARVEPAVWQRAGRAINQRERLRLRYQRFDGVGTTCWSPATWSPTTAIGTFWRSTQPLAAWKPLPSPAAAPSPAPGSTSRAPSRSTRKPSSRTPSASARLTNPGACACSLPVRSPPTSANGRGTPASNCDSAATAPSKSASKPPAGRNSPVGFCHGCRTSECWPRASSKNGCENECVRDWLTADDPHRWSSRSSVKASAPGHLRLSLCQLASPKEFAPASGFSYRQYPSEHDGR